MNSSTRAMNATAALNVLMIASRAGHARVVRSILQQSHVAESTKGWYVNLRAPDNSCGNGKTALMFAAAGGHYGGCRFLLQAGASPHMRDRNNFTAAMIASMGKKLNKRSAQEEHLCMRVKHFLN